MNIRSLTRGDGVVIGAAVLLFIASFLNLYDSSVLGSSAPNAWDSLGTVMSIHLAGVIAAGLIVAARALPQPRKIVGLDLGQFGVALAIFAAWTALWSLIGLDGIDAGSGLILGFIAALVLAGAAVATPLVPALKGALVGAPRPRTPQPYGGQPGGPQQGYGYPGGQQPYGTQGQAQPFGAQGGQGSLFGGGQPQGGQQGQPPAGGAAPAGDFAPFWFAVPVARPLFGEDGSPSPIAELAPGTWYLAVEQRGQGLVAQTQDGRRGVLQDTSGIQRG
ncbi:hypothetical protein KQY30_25520 [Streptomyces sp. GMY02]|uniref:DUF5336 domain-containing protein n=1 Tax=Streptomyces sp. GMY02 TaxID=1333528 RepID=UPI001C2C8C1B|nr:DUF5336 domain-containing protein [Streptomyces sp. GMY02]QXE37078.1 hypothetical protein KQY30_25520 [Streptomyces sp. GMY02]